MSAPRLVAVVAAARNGVIGRAGELPWRLPGDLAHYRRVTMGKPMVMGRRTLDSIGRVLDGRDTVVLTRAASLPYPDALLARDPDEALRIAADCAARRGPDEIVIAGGGEVFGLFWSRIDRVVLTRVEAEPEGDAWLPPLVGSGLRLVEEGPRERHPRDEADSRLEIWERG